MADKYVNAVGVQTIKEWIQSKFALDADLDALSDRVEEIIEEGGEPNTIESISVNGTAVTPDANKNVELSVPEITIDKTTGNTTIESDGTNLVFEAMDKGSEIYNIRYNMQDGHFRLELASIEYVAANGGKIDVIKVNGTAQTITNKEVDLTIPTKVSELTNDGDGTQGSTFPTTAEMETAIESAVVGAVKPKGAIPFASLPALTAANLNNMYDITDAFTTTADFKDGAGKSFPAGTNVVIINVGTDASPVYKYDTYVGVQDLSAYWTSTSGQSNTLEAMTVAEINAILNAS